MEQGPVSCTHYYHGIHEEMILRKRWLQMRPPCIWGGRNAAYNGPVELIMAHMLWLGFFFDCVEICG
ncbi:unnamed protein product [Ilex paraguariensis]|uniref:Uncharacterized protein n=1 Tax=Ilex paraguariensis TaxID=185542 RepID=A0ABC8U4N3_9AQUA